jgi:hypothetical protein
MGIDLKIYRWRVSSLNYSYQMQYQQNDGNNDQRMDPIAGARHSWADIPAQKAEQPQDDENYDDGPQHKISP